MSLTTFTFLDLQSPSIFTFKAMGHHPYRTERLQPNFLRSLIYFFKDNLTSVSNVSDESDSLFPPFSSDEKGEKKPKKKEKKRKQGNGRRLATRILLRHSYFLSHLVFRSFNFTGLSSPDTDDGMSLGGFTPVV